MVPAVSLLVAFLATTFGLFIVFFPGRSFLLLARPGHLNKLGRTEARLEIEHRVGGLIMTAMGIVILLNEILYYRMRSIIGERAEFPFSSPISTPVDTSYWYPFGLQAIVGLYLVIRPKDLARPSKRKYPDQPSRERITLRVALTNRIVGILLILTTFWVLRAFLGINY